MVYDNEASILRGKESLPALEHSLLHRSFEEMLKAKPEELSNRICIREYDTKLEISYGDLNKRANKLARVLINKVKDSTCQNPDGDFLVALRFLPSIELVVTMVALAKCGLSYVPIAPNWPPGRIALILSDAKPLMVITNAKADLIYKAVKEVSESNPDSPSPSIYQVADLEGESSSDESNLAGNEGIFCNNSAAQASVKKENTLYAVLYTSGSTGRPKGARITHRATFNRIMWQWQTFPYRQNDVCIFKTTLTFVDSISEIWGPLLQAVPFFILPNKVTQNVELFVEALENCRVTRLFAVTSLVRNILSFVSMESKKKLSKVPRLSEVYQWECSAETVTPDLVRQFFQLYGHGKSTLCNFYGSTEMMDVTFATFSSLNDLEGKLDSFGKVPIGEPIINSAAYVLDDSMQLVGQGEIGQLYVSSPNLCDGYVGTKASTFLPNMVENPPESGNGLLYRTGDYVRLENGLLYYEGRCDSQIKVRGHRVDLSEIEKAVKSFDAIDKAVVLCYKPNEPAQKVLCYFTVNTKEEKNYPMNEVTLEEKLRGELPCYMLPKPIKVPIIPLLVNGKIDRQALLKRYEESRKSTFDFSDQDLESYLCPDHFERGRLLLNAVAQVLLSSEKPLLSDNFFDIGGDSLNMVQVISRCFDFGYTIGITEFSLSNNLAAVVHCMDQSSSTTEFSKLKDLASQDFGFVSEPLTFQHKETVVDMISRSFADKGDLTTLANVKYEDIAEQVDVLWTSLLQANLSIVIKDEKGQIIGACLNFDARSDEAAPLCAASAFSRNMADLTDETKPVIKEAVEAVPMSVVEFIDAIEEPLKDQYLPEAIGKTIYASLLGTAANLTPADNVKVTLYMEMENIRFGKAQGYEGIFTTNANRLTQHISRILNYQILSTIQVNQYEDVNGARPFSEAPDDLVTEVALKWF